MSGQIEGYEAGTFSVTDKDCVFAHGVNMKTLRPRPYIVCIHKASRTKVKVYVLEADIPKTCRLAFAKLTREGSFRSWANRMIAIREKYEAGMEAKQRSGLVLVRGGQVEPA